MQLLAYVRLIMNYKKYHAQKKFLKFALVVELAQPTFTYITVLKIAKARPHSVEWQTDSSVQKQ